MRERLGCVKDEQMRRISAHHGLLLRLLLLLLLLLLCCHVSSASFWKSSKSFECSKELPSTSRAPPLGYWDEPSN